MKDENYGYYHDANINKAPEKLKKAAQNPEKRCVLCSRRMKTEKERNWRTILLNHSITIYICPDEFPPDSKANVGDFKEAYMQGIRTAYKIMEHKS